MGEMGLITFFVLEVPDYKSATLIYLYVTGVVKLYLKLEKRIWDFVRRRWSQGLNFKMKKKSQFLKLSLANRRTLEN